MARNALTSEKISPPKKGKGAAYMWLRAHVDHQGNECLRWPFSAPNGYGQFGYCGQLYYAHRFMCELAHGAPPSPKHEAAHECGHGYCVNPRHLSWKTTSENQLDRSQHGTRNSWGARGKLTPEAAAQIRALAGKKPQREIAAMFGISRSQVSWVVTGKAWTRTRKGYIKEGRKYRARIRVNNEYRSLGLHETAEAAHADYMAENAKARASLSGGE